jgi:hypothetical protein
MYESAKKLVQTTGLTLADADINYRKQQQIQFDQFCKNMEEKIIDCRQRSQVVGRYGIYDEI